MNSLSDEIIIARILDGRHDDFANLVNRYENEVKQLFVHLFGTSMINKISYKRSGSQHFKTFHHFRTIKGFCNG